LFRSEFAGHLGRECVQQGQERSIRPTETYDVLAGGPAFVTGFNTQGLYQRLIKLAARHEPETKR